MWSRGPDIENTAPTGLGRSGTRSSAAHLAPTTQPARPVWKAMWLSMLWWRPPSKGGFRSTFRRRLPSRGRRDTLWRWQGSRLRGGGDRFHPTTCISGIATRVSRCAATAPQSRLDASWPGPERQNLEIRAEQGGCDWRRGAPRYARAGLWRVRSAAALCGPAQGVVRVIGAARGWRPCARSAGVPAWRPKLARRLRASADGCRARR